MSKKKASEEIHSREISNVVEENENMEDESGINDRHLLKSCAPLTQTPLRRARPLCGHCKLFTHRHCIERSVLRLEEHSADGIKTPFTDSNEVHSAVIGIGKAFVGTEAYRGLLKYKAITVSNAETGEVCLDCRVENRTKDYDGNKQ